MATPKGKGKKTAIKTVTSPINGAQLPVGNHPGNTGGKKGRSGRKPDEWRRELQALVSSDAVLDALETVLQDSKHPAYVGALKYAADHGFGKARETVELTGASGGPVLVKFVHEDRKRTAS